jgi:cytochrome c biogenesis protein CcdA
LVGSVTSCCSLPVLGAIAGYSAALQDSSDRRTLLVTALWFMIGTAAALATLGAVSGFLGHLVSASVGVYWRLFAGFVTVLFGLASLSLLPFDLAHAGLIGNRVSIQSSGATIYGVAVGGGSAACSVFCNPILPVALAVTTLQGNTLWGAAILAVFSLGYSAPMAGVLVGLGLGFGKLKSAMQKMTPVIQTVAGALLVAMGFYLLATP